MKKKFFVCFYVNSAFSQLCVVISQIQFLELYSITQVKSKDKLFYLTLLDLISLRFNNTISQRI